MKDDYTSRRTSKVTYRSEAALPYPTPLEEWSRRIENAARLGRTLAWYLSYLDGAYF